MGQRCTTDGGYAGDYRGHPGRLKQFNGVHGSMLGVRKMAEQARKSVYTGGITNGRSEITPKTRSVSMAHLHRLGARDRGVERHAQAITLRPDQRVEAFAHYGTIVFLGLLGLWLVWHTPKPKPEKTDDVGPD